MVACKTEQTKDMPLSSKAGEWYCNCIQKHLPLKDSMDIRSFCYDELSNDDTFGFVRYFWGANGGDDSLLFQKYHDDYTHFIPIKDSCDRVAIPDNKKIQLGAITCQENDWLKQIHLVKIMDSLQFLFPIEKHRKDTMKEIETFCTYYKGCLNTTHINIKFPLVDYAYIPSKFATAMINDKNVTVIVDTSGILTFLEWQPLFEWNLSGSKKSYLAYPIWIVNKSDSTIICGKGKTKLYFLYLEEKRGNNWIRLSTYKNFPDTPVPPLILKPHQVILSKCPILNTKYPKRLKLSYNSQTVYSNIF